jgi:hypothetical protein
MANPKGALNVERRTWDIEEYERKAKERLEQVGTVLTHVCWLRLAPLTIITRSAPPVTASVRGHSGEKAGDGAQTGGVHGSR